MSIILLCFFKYKPQWLHHYLCNKILELAAVQPPNGEAKIQILSHTITVLKEASRITLMMPLLMGLLFE